MKAMIFAAGFGTRLRPLTDSMPKALVPVAGVPMLERVIMKLQAAGFSEFVVNAHHFSEQICDFVEARGSFGADVKISVEQEAALETGGGIKRASQLLRGGRFLVHNVDILSDLDVKWFLSQDEDSSLATLLLVDKEADRYLLFDDDMRLVGWTNVRTGEVKSPYPDLDVAACRRYSFCGVHIMSEEVLGLMEDWPESFSIIDFYLQNAAEHCIRGVLCPELNLIDIGSPEKLARANVMEFLSAHDFKYEIYEHPPLFTIDEALDYWKKIDESHTDGTGPLHCKNLFFRNHKGNRHYLVSFDCHKNLDIHSLEHMLHQGKLSFASEERMWRCLGLRPGSVSLFGLIKDMDCSDANPKELFDNGHRVKFFFDSDLLEAPAVSFHPCDNTATVVISREEFKRFLALWGGEWETLEIGE